MATHTYDLGDANSDTMYTGFVPQTRTTHITNNATSNIPKFSKVTDVVASTRCYQGTRWSTGDLKIGFGAAEAHPTDLFYNQQHVVLYGSENATTRSSNNMAARFASETANAGAYTGGLYAFSFCFTATLPRYWFSSQNKIVWTYDPPTFTLNVASGGGGSVSGGGAKTIASKTATYTWNLTATPSAGYRFVSWSDGNTSASRSYSVTENDLTGFATSVSLTATFAPSAFALTVEKTGNGAALGTVTGGGSYAPGTSVQITASAATGAYFDGWTDGNTSATRTVVVNGAATYTARFLLHTYTVAATVPGGGGTVTGAGTYNYGSTCTLTAIPATSPITMYHFVRWSDGNTNATRSFTVTGAVTLEAVFERTSYPLTWNLTGCTASVQQGVNADGRVYHGVSLVAFLTASAEYALPSSVSVTMGGAAVTPVYDADTGLLAVNNVTGALVITVTAVSLSTIPVVTVTTDVDKISDETGCTKATATFMADKAYSAYEIRATAEGAAYGRGIGILLVSATSATPANTLRTHDIYYNHLTLGDGVYRISVYVCSGGVWSV